MLETLRTEWKAGLTIARATLDWRAHIGNNPFSWFFTSMLLVAPVVIIAITGRWSYGVGMGAGVSLLILGIFWWSMLLYCLLLQNHGGGSLLPALRRRSIGVLLVCGGAGTLCIAALFTLAGVAPLMALLGVATLFAALAIFIVWPVLLGALFVLLLSAMLYDAPALRDMFRETSGRVWIISCSALVPLMMYLAVSGFFRLAARSELHLLRDTRAQTRSIDNFFHLGAGRRLERAVRTAGTGELLLHGLGPRMKLPLLLVLAPLLVFGIPLVIWGPTASDDSRFMLQTMMVLFSSLVLFVIPPSVPLVFARSRNEQALLRLCGRSPESRLLNALLARALVRQLLVQWSSWAASLLLFAWAGGVPVNNLPCLLPTLVLPLLQGGVMLRDYASAAGAQTGARESLLMLVCFLGSVLLGMVALNGKLSIPASLAIGVPILLAALVFLSVRWRAMLRSSPALPSARRA